MEALIAAGSNIDGEINLARARTLLAAHPAINLRACSPLYITAAIGADGAPANQPPFYNAAFRVATTLHAADLRRMLRTIEAQLGRVRSADKFAPRPIDLDIAYYGLSALHIENKPVPDDDVVRYAHVAAPLADVAPEWLHPVTGQTLAAIAQPWANQPLEKRSWTLI